MSRRPDFFIVGAPKCGTTALFRYLAAHPSVFMPESKEPNYFCTDLPRYGHVATPAEYEALFSPAQPEALTGEASALYLYSKIAISRVMAHNAAAKIIVMLRDPIEAARSMHAFQWSYELEDVFDFEEAWRLQKARLEGQKLPPRWPYPDHLQYGALYLYAPQVRRLLAQTPRTQCLFLVFEEFFTDPSRQFGRVLEFLGLPPAPASTTFPVVNRTIGVRSAVLDRVLRRPPAALVALRNAAHAVNFHPLRALQRLNRVAGQKPPLRKAFRAELEDYFSADLMELEQLLGRRLWPQKPSAVQPR
ncbi:MAG TPA: sulfotransferase [Steroidobacteraceae bacterium]|nr:sulfotransferase [Steroidobacteraceae bacterium]